MSMDHLQSVPDDQRLRRVAVVLVPAAFLAACATVAASTAILPGDRLAVWCGTAAVLAGGVAVLVEHRRNQRIRALYAAVVKQERSASSRLAEQEAAVKAEEAMRQYAQRAFVNIARRVQAIVHQQLADLREMEERHGGAPDVFGDLLRVDHGTALIGRLADSIAVLGGERPGRQWTEAIAVLSVLRGAMSRIIDYRRVDIDDIAGAALVGPVVEPVIHALAELLDNATRYSPPESRVHLTAQRVQAGVVIVVEDAGIGLGPEAAARADRILSAGSVGLNLAELGTSTRLGLSVAGCLARANGFEVSLRRSAYGGVRAVIFLPHMLIAEPPPPGSASPAESQAVRVEVEGQAAAVATALPRRRRKGAVPAVAGPPASGDSGATDQPGRSAPGDQPQPGLWVGSSRVDLQACKLEYSIVSPK